MTGVLRIYDPAECDEHGVPLDWERCRCQREVPGGMGSLADALFQRNEVCPDCGGHGSLKAAALAALTRERDGMTIADMPIGPEAYRRRVFEGRPVRCEGCGHPMSDGTWAPDVPRTRSGKPLTLPPVLTMAHAVYFEDLGSVLWSPCDEGCRHGRPWRWQAGFDERGQWLAGERPEPVGRIVEERALVRIEASWRAVDVRTMGWPHDLRPNKLATLCLCCWADRTRA